MQTMVAVFPEVILEQANAARLGMEIRKETKIQEWTNKLYDHKWNFKRKWFLGPRNVRVRTREEVEEYVSKSGYIPFLPEYSFEDELCWQMYAIKESHAKVELLLRQAQTAYDNETVSMVVSADTLMHLDEMVKLADSIAV